MLPILFRGTVAGHNIVVGSYSAFMVLAWVAMIALGAAFAARRGLGWRRPLGVLAGGLLGGVVGARLLDATLSWRLYAAAPGRLFALGFQGFSLYGGLIGGALAALALARWLRVDAWRLADAAVPGLAVGIALMRVGCFLRGCCFGLPTHLPWGVSFPPGSAAWSQQLLTGATGVLAGVTGVSEPVHPTQLYELAAALLVALGALAWQRRTRAAELAGVSRRFHCQQESANSRGNTRR